MGSSPTPWPSGSIQCIPDVRVGSDARSSRHVLGNETLLPTDRSPMAVKTSLSFSNSLISNSCCKSFSSSRVTFDFNSSKCVTFNSSSSNLASLAANPSLILLSIWNRTGSLLYDVRTICLKLKKDSQSKWNRNFLHNLWIVSFAIGRPGKDNRPSWTKPKSRR